jgi:WD40 repeat protein
LFQCCNNGSGRGTLNIFDVASGKRVGNVDGPEPSLAIAEKIAVSPDQRLVAMDMGGGTSAYGYVAVANTRDWKFDLRYRVPKGLTSFGFGANSQDIFFGTTDGVVSKIDTTSAGPARDLYSAAETMSSDPEISAIAGSPDGDLIFVGGQARWDQPTWIRVIRVSDGARLATFSRARVKVNQVAWDPQGRYVAFLDGGNNIFLWRPLVSPLSYGRIIMPGPPGEGMGCMAVAPDGNHIAASTNDGVIIFKVGNH